MKQQTAGQRLKDWRGRAKWTQQQVADAIGVDNSFVSHLEKDAYRPSLETAFRLQRLTGIPAEAWINKAA